MLLIRSIFFTILQPGTVAVFIPYWLITSRGVAPPYSIPALRYLGLPLMIIGAAGLLWASGNSFPRAWDHIASDPPNIWLSEDCTIRSQPDVCTGRAALIGESSF